MAVKDPKEKQHLFDNPRNVRRLLWIFYVCVGLLLLADLVIHRHAYFSWEEWFGFYPVYGFIACVILVLVSKYVLRPLVMRKEDYYD